MTGSSAAGAPTVVVVGGGIAGLAGAWELLRRRPDARVVVLEAAGRLGGKIESAEVGGRQVDLGPDAFLARRPEALGLCRELGLQDELVSPGARTSYLWSGGRLHPLPAGLALGVPTRLAPLAGSGILSPGSLGRVAADLLTPPWAGGDHGHAGGAGHLDGAAGAGGADEAIGPLVARRLGQEVVDQLADPLIGGIHAGTVDTLSAAAVFPPLLAAAHRRGSLLRNLRTAVPPPADPDAPVFMSLRGGLPRLVARLAEELTARGAELRTGAAVTGMTRRAEGGWLLDTGDAAEPLAADAVLLALPAPAAAHLVRGTADELAGLLGAVAYSSVTLVTLRFAPETVRAELAGTGYLVPRRDGALLTACTWLSVKWPELARPDDVLVRVSAGRYGDERPARLDDDELVRRAVDELTPALGLAGSPLEARVTRFPDAFPQYEVGHLARIDALERAATRAGRLAVAGALLRGVGIPACIGSGRDAAGRLLGELGELAAHGAP